MGGSTTNPVDEALAKWTTGEWDHVAACYAPQASALNELSEPVSVPELCDKSLKAYQKLITSKADTQPQNRNLWMDVFWTPDDAPQAGRDIFNQIFDIYLGEALDQETETSPIFQVDHAALEAEILSGLNEQAMQAHARAYHVWHGSPQEFDPSWIPTSFYDHLRSQGIDPTSVSHLDHHGSFLSLTYPNGTLTLSLDPKYHRTKPKTTEPEVDYYDLDQLERDIAFYLDPMSAFDDDDFFWPF